MTIDPTGGARPAGASHQVLPYSIQFQPFGQHGRSKRGLVGTPSVRFSRKNLRYDLGRGAERMTYEPII
jgi:hypothetical protein